MKILIVGGTGLVGATAAVHLRTAGHDVTLMSRHEPTMPPLTEFAHLRHDYVNDDIAVETLAGFDALVFSAAADIRAVPEGADMDAFFMHANTERVPFFIAQAKAAGIAKTVYIGTFYPQVVPDKIATSAYVRSRHLADEAVRGMADEHFSVCSLNAPYILGRFAGVEAPHLVALAQYAAGRLEGLPLVAPKGGVNHISSQSMAEAILGALENGENGKAYLVGDENLSWKAYLELYCDAAGNPQDLAVSEDEHPMFPDIILYAGRNATVSYEPENGVLNYRQNRIRETVEDILAAYLD